MFFFLLNIYVSWYIYCYTDTTKRMYCSYNSAFDLVIDTVATVTEVFFFSFSNRFVFFFLLKIYISWYIYCYTIATNFIIFSQLLTGTVAIVPFFFLVIGLCFFFLLNIYVSWYIYYYTDTTNFTIFSQLLTCQFLISRNKIIKYEIVTNHN